MAKSDKIAKRGESAPAAGGSGGGASGSSTSKMDDVFEDFRREMESMMTSMRPWPSLWRLPRMRVPLCDMIDRGDRFELQLEVPGVEKDKVQVHATEDAVEVSGSHEEKSEEKEKEYVYKERSQRSFYRKVPLPEEVDPSRVSARMSNGLLVIDLPKKEPARASKARKVEVQ
ncbi:Hsp20/alpha crystallin family protein [Nitrososphaera sp.]|uniref:Hsp20/alpha crystallin family protein n=1 Tax=Nitrososphaera sp. TaxID=1971748 RepID=UPI00307E9F9B